MILRITFRSLHKTVDTQPMDWENTTNPQVSTYIFTISARLISYDGSPFRPKYLSPALVFVTMVRCT